jgi:hypothetical protein
MQNTVEAALEAPGQGRQKTQRSGQTAPHLSPISRFPDGSFAWPVRDQRAGRYIVVPPGPSISAPMGMAVLDDFGTLVAVPSVDVLGACVLPVLGPTSWGSGDTVAGPWPHEVRMGSPEPLL